MNPEVLSRWLPILRFLYANPYTPPRKLAAYFNATPQSMVSTISNMRRFGYLKKHTKTEPGFHLTEKALKLLPKA